MASKLAPSLATNRNAHQPPVSILPRCELVATPTTRMAPYQFPSRLHANSSNSSSRLGQTLPSWAQNLEANKHPNHLLARHHPSFHQGIQPVNVQDAIPDTFKESHKPDLPEDSHQREKMAPSSKPRRSQDAKLASTLEAHQAPCRRPRRKPLVPEQRKTPHAETDAKPSGRAVSLSVAGEEAQAAIHDGNLRCRSRSLPAANQAPKL